MSPTIKMIDWEITCFKRHPNALSIKLIELHLKELAAVDPSKVKEYQQVVDQLVRVS